MCATCAVRANKEAGEYFRTGQYEEAATAYTTAIRFDRLSTASTVYFTNLAAAYLKLERFLEAGEAASDALIRDPRSVKARYRRGVATKALGWLTACLFDFYNVLVLDPSNQAARSLFMETFREYNIATRNPVTPAQMAPLDRPAVHALSALDSPSPSQLPAGSGRERIKTSTKEKLRGCSWCAARVNYKKSKTCAACTMVMYCDRTCQRNHWQTHKRLCPSLASLKPFLRRVTKLGSDVYMNRLLKFYAIRAMGFLTPHPIPGPAIMIVRVGQTTADIQPRCLTLENVHIAYLGLLPESEQEDYWNHIAAAGIPSSRCVYTMFTPAIDQDHGQELMDAIESQTSIVGVQPAELEEIRRRGNTVEVESPVFGGTRTLALDLDVLFRHVIQALEEEIALDEHNIRGFRIV
ncbi:hypothetical protein DFH06DRAFT_1466479 [Mycena polygramma]|nr:hypothetical protein DFH06DRAFT_1466479 [Mycena polygramma]